MAFSWESASNTSNAGSTQLIMKMNEPKTPIYSSLTDLHLGIEAKSQRRVGKGRALRFRLITTRAFYTEFHKNNPTVTFAKYEKICHL